MTPVWDADTEISVEQAAQLIAGQFKALACERIELIGVGWDNTAFLVDGQFVFRFPRRALGAALLANEMRALPLISSGVRLPVPVPAFHGQPAGDYPYEFAGYRMIAGITACRVLWTAEGKEEIASWLGRFLSELHAIPITAEIAAWAPGDELRRADISFRAPQLKEKLAALRTAPAGVDCAAVSEIVDRLAASAPWAGPPCWVHGDLYARHLLIDSHELLCGVIDWGDVHLGDPAIDLSIVYSFLPSGARSRFWQAYGAVDEYTMNRARFRALNYGPILIAYGEDVGDQAIRQIGIDALLYGSQ